MDSSLVITERRGACLLLMLNRPERHHALNAELSEALATAFQDAAADPTIAAVIITGSGDKAFCAGADMVEASGAGSKGGSLRGSAVALNTVANAPMPVIAAINGYCYGGGAQLAINCDLRLAADSATFRFPGSEYGLVVAAATLPRLVGAARAKDLIFTARKFSASDALDYGLVNSVHAPADLLPAAWTMAEQIAGMSGPAVRAAKAVIDTATISEAAAAMEAGANGKLRGSADQMARFRAATTRVTGR